MVLQNYTPTQVTINHLQPAFLTLRDKMKGASEFTIALCDDNSAFMKATNAQKAAEQKTTLYPPPSSDVIQTILYSMRQARLIVLLTNSTLCVYKAQKETALLEWILESNEVLDCEGKRAINMPVTCMEIF